MLNPEGKKNFTEFIMLDDKVASGDNLAVQQSTRRLTECALMTAFSVILHLSSLVPGLSLVTILLCALPSIYIALVYGFRWVAASTMAASAILFTFVGLFEAVNFVILFALTGAALGLMVRAGQSPSAVLAVGTIAVLAGMLVTVYLVENLMGISESREVISWFKGAADTYYDYIDKAREALGLSRTGEESKKRVGLFLELPLAIFGAMSFLTVYANFLAATLIFYRLGIPFEHVPDPRNFRLPSWFSGLWCLLYLLPLDSLLSYRAARIAFLNLFYGGAAFLFLAGLSLLIYKMDALRLHPVFRLVFLLLFLFPLHQVSIAAALADSFFDFRGLSDLSERYSHS